MLKFINLKKFTSYSLIVAVIAGVLISQPTIAGNGNGNGNNGQSCNSNNGHGNNAPIPLTLSSGKKLTVTQFDPSNPGKGDYISKRIKAANSNLTDSEFLEAKDQLLKLVNDIELRDRSSNRIDCETDTNNVRERDLSDGKTLKDVDGDGTPNRNDNDGIEDDEDEYPYIPLFSD